MKHIVLILILLTSPLFANTSSPSKAKPIREIVKKQYPKESLYIGATSNFSKTKGIEGRILLQEFSYITPDNDFKQSYIHPMPGTWKWEAPDGWIYFAEKNNQVVRIHGPISPQSSRWAQEDNRTSEELLKNMTEYMTELCRRYNGKKCVKWMDVVNEVVSRNGKWKPHLKGTGKWEMPWTRIGYNNDIPDKFTHLDGKVPLFIIKAFEIAKEHAPNIKLVLNQHGGMEEAMWNKVKDLVLYLRSRGLRVDGIGWQGHIKITGRNSRANQWETNMVNIKNLQKLIQWAHQNDLEFHITEFNIHTNKEDDTGERTKEAKITHDIFSTLLAERNNGLVTWNLWDISDTIHYNNKSILKVGAWNSQYKPHEVYRTVQELLINPPSE
ncbi:MAG: endo-1,4-beta-xylanase [Planctomycetes bacterium]|nr:endo-1,4-beta-xylanase [Planctomycetota bacterium]